MRFKPLFILSLLSISSAVAVAALQPEEVAILAARNSPNSVALAKYYAKQRAIPAEQICELDFPQGEVLDRAVWETTTRPAIRKWIVDNNFQSRIRCFVTVWDVPLKIGQQQVPDSETKRRTEYLTLVRQQSVDQLRRLASEIDAIGRSIAETERAQAPSVGATATIEELVAEVTTAMRGAESRIQPMLDEVAKQAASQQLMSLSSSAAGANLLRASMGNAIKAGQGNEQVNAQYQLLTGRISALAEARNLMEGLDPSLERDAQLLALIQMSDGISGNVSWIDQQQQLLAMNETNASFDSELSLVMRGPYPLLRWQTNFLHFRYDDSPLREFNKTVMVSRLEAPTLKLTKELIDTAIRVEKEGLTGKVYLDARGVAPAEGQQFAAGSINDYDRSLLLTEQFLKQHTKLEVVLDNQSGLFPEGSCPDAAIYCGWYSLAKYVDAFDWKPGAVGYHIASSEATTLRDPASQVWCKRMLEDGICATLGPVYEPYLLAFPRPSEFIPLLVGGNHTYVECVYRTKAFNSWMMTVVGDPLYNPFAGKDLIKDPPAAYLGLLGR